MYSKSVLRGVKKYYEWHEGYETIGEKMRIVVRKFRRETGITTEQQQDR